jgi:hypothetical protein
MTAFLGRFSRGNAKTPVLGGYFALQHYAAYRRTHDIDAWWKTRANPATEQAIREAMQRLATDDGYELQERRFGETVSFELVRAGKRELSFQIAVRSIGLEQPVASAWPPLLIEALADNLASKMSALVDRGAPHDFTDMKHVVEEGLVTVEGAWELWCRKNPVARLSQPSRRCFCSLRPSKAGGRLSQSGTTPSASGPGRRASGSSWSFCSHEP